MVALSGAVTTRLQPVCLAIALSASRAVPRGWSMETTGIGANFRIVSHTAVTSSMAKSEVRSRR